MGGGETLWVSGAAFAAALLALGCTGILAGKPSASLSRRLVAVFLASGLIQVANGLNALDASHEVFWRRLALSGELAQPVALLYAGVGLMAAGDSPAFRAALWRARAVGVVAAALVVCSWTVPAWFAGTVRDGRLSVTYVGPLGQVAAVFLVVASALAIAQIEQMFRASREPLRSQLKLVLIGLAALATYGIYQSSRLLLIPVWQADYIVVGGLATLVSLSLIGFGLGRSRLAAAAAHIAVSPQVLYGSMSFVIVGVYLVLVGLIGEAIRRSGISAGFAIGTTVVFVAIVAFAVILLSRPARAHLRTLIARHFVRAKYDYRAAWLEVTESFRACATTDEILDQLMELLSRTFGAARITLWMHVEADGCFHQIRSITADPSPLPLDATHPLIVRLMETDGPVDVALGFPDGPSPDAASFKSFLAATRAVLCAPIRSGGNLLAFLTLSHEPWGAEYGIDDRDLLRAISHHVGVMLAHAQLAEERREAAELEALYRLSAFCLHDLKNLATRLSLIAQNASLHGRNPAFQDSAMRTVAATVHKMTGLISKLSVTSMSMNASEPVDVPSVIEETLSAMANDDRVEVQLQSRPVPPVMIVRDHLQQVLLNIFLNARQAVGERGRILVSTEPSNGSVVVTVADTGPGISAAALRPLFRPFRSTKASGFGIGLYQCKQIIEVHHGTIRVHSDEGQGTRVRIELPSVPSDRLPTVPDAYQPTIPNP